MAALNLGKRLVKELKRERKKAAILGLLLLGGSCIWVPQLWKVMILRKAGSTAAQNRPQPVPTTAKNTPAVLAPPTGAPSDWKSLCDQVDNAPLAQAVTFDELVRDPFDRDWIRQKMASSKTKPDQALPPAIDPINTLICSATLVGPNIRAAIIGDKIYEIGQKLPFEGSVQYVVKDIQNDRVLLECDGRVATLKVTQSMESLRPAVEPAKRPPEIAQPLLDEGGL